MTWTFQINTALSFLGTGPGVIAAALIAAIFLFSFVQNGRWMAICLLLACSAFSINRAKMTLITPLQQIRSVSEVLTVCFLGFLILPALFVRRNNLRSAILPAAVIFLALEIFYAMRVSGVVDIGKAATSLMIYTALFAVFAHGLPRWLRRWPDSHVAIRCLGVTSLIFVGCTVCQLIANPAGAVRGSRLYAITGNPQHAAMALAIFTVPIEYLLTSPRERLALRILWGANLGMTAVLLAWTGSRTGVLMALVGTAIHFRSRIGRFMGMAAVSAIFAFMFFAFFEVSNESTSRLLSTVDTRSNEWAVQLENFKANPLIGSVSDYDFGTVENSYLTIAAHTGLIGLTLLTAFLCSVGFALRRLARIRALSPSAEFRAMADMIAGGIVGILVGAIFEGILVGTLTFMVFALYLYLGLLKIVTDEQTVEEFAYDTAPDQIAASEEDLYGNYGDAGAIQGGL